MISDSSIGPPSAEPTSDWSVFIPALVLSAILGTALLFLPDTTASNIIALRNWITSHLGWAYLAVAVGSLLFCIWLAFGRFGNIKLGREDEPPEYSNAHWIAMMFTAGIGAGLIVWGFAEPIYYVQNPPFGIEPFSPAAYEWAHMYPIFHWGIIPWAIYAVAAVPIAYILYVREDPYLRLSHTIADALPGAGHPLTATVVDVLIMLGILGGTATSLGLGVPLVSAFLSELSGQPDTNDLKLVVLVFYTLLFGASAYRGLKKGIKVLADINLVLAIAVMVLIVVVGPSLFIFKISINSVGLLLDNFWRMSFWTDPVGGTTFYEDWTVFYWAWWIAFAGFIGLFFGRISRGRTIRQLIVGVIGWGSLGTTLFLMIAGAFSLHLELNEIYPVSDTLTNTSLSYTVTQVISQLAFGKITLFVFFVLAIVFYATTLDSAAYVLASVCSRDLHNDQEPPRYSRLVWAGVLAFITWGLVERGALGVTMASTIIFSLPLIPIIIMMCISQVKWFQRDYPELSNQ